MPNALAAASSCDGDLPSNCSRVVSFKRLKQCVKGVSKSEFQTQQLCNSAALNIIMNAVRIVTDIEVAGQAVKAEGCNHLRQVAGLPALMREAVKNVAAGRDIAPSMTRVLLSLSLKDSVWVG